MSDIVSDSIEKIILNLEPNEGLGQLDNLLQKHGETIYTEDGKNKPFADVLEIMSKVWNSLEKE